MREGHPNRPVQADERLRGGSARAKTEHIAFANPGKPAWAVIKTKSHRPCRGAQPRVVPTGHVTIDDGQQQARTS